MKRILLCLALVACKTATAPSPPDAGTPDAGGGPLPALKGVLVDPRFRVADHMRASLEMQLSGEPFAQLLGYNLAGFNRQLVVTDQYTDPATGVKTTDPLAYALAIESYEYSKQPMNNLSFESGAGLALSYGPVQNPGGATGDGAFQLLADRFQNLAIASNSGGPPGKNLITSPAPSSNPANRYGWPGLWPIFAEFSDFDPAVKPWLGGLTNSCTFGGAIPGAFGYGGPVMPHGALIANYECDYNSLHLVDRERQVTRRLEPAALGYAAWKQALWTINYWQSLCDVKGNGIVSVDAADLAKVGVPGNTVVGRYPDPADPTGARLIAGAPGVYLGDIPMEGWQGLTMLDEMDNKAGFLLGSLLSADGATLGGAGSVKAALDYSYDSPLLYFPSSVEVVEAPADATAPTKYFPRPTQLTIASSDSALAGLSGLVGGFGEAFAVTDKNNATVGGSQPFRATFDGDPFPDDDGLPDGEATLHDRALGVLKVALVDLDRLHFDPGAKVLVDSVSVRAGVPTRGTKVTTVELAEAILALRNAYRALNGSLQLYSNDTPDTQGAPAALDLAPLTGAPYAGPLQARLVALVRAEADFLAAKLVAPDGAVANGYDLAANAPDAAPTDLAAEAAAVRGLLEAYLVTSDDRYRERATDAYRDLDARFWQADVQAYRTTAGVDTPLKYTPARFGLLWGAMRQYYKLVASAPLRHAQGVELLRRAKRVFKLVVNGWNDRNQDDKVDYPAECAGAGLELGERALTGELGHPFDPGDRDHDCVREISTVKLPAALGAEVDFTR